MRFAVLVSVAVFLSWTLPALGHEPTRARALYLLHCSGCHATNGEGGGPRSGVPDFRNLVGAFAGDDLGRTYVLHVPGVANTSLDDEGIADILNYVMDSWGCSSLPSVYEPFTATEVKARRARAVADVVTLRREVVHRLEAKGIASAAYPWP